MLESFCIDTFTLFITRVTIQLLFRVRTCILSRARCTTLLLLFPCFLELILLLLQDVSWTVRSAHGLDTMAFNFRTFLIDSSLYHHLLTYTHSGSGDYFHQLHHAHFDCNYGAMHFPMDKWLGTYAGSKEDVRKIWGKKPHGKKANKTPVHASSGSSASVSE